MLQGAKEAEKMIVEAYSALLLAFLSTERSVSCAAINLFIRLHPLRVSHELLSLLGAARAYVEPLLHVFPVRSCL